ncbi:hypothetical protein MKW94_017824 [Papaver nudicaule]|uniref:BED-type domain-containing protein n=1 Tax=Papaver nudicaule TaxID=74823 RepID=A0AA41UWE4_PAPNU|nr:hypothetical protein [Papaver nudicaule]
MPPRVSNVPPTKTVSKKPKEKQPKEKQPEVQTQRVLEVQRVPEVEDVVSDDSDDSDSDDSPEVEGAPKRKRTSKIWLDFEQIKVNGIVVQGKCKHCKKVLGAKSENGTSNLKKHLRSCFKFKLTQKGIDQMYLQASEKEDGAIAAFNFRYNQEVTRHQIARMIILHELPFTFVEYVGFRRVVKSLQPSYKFVQRNTTKTDCMKVVEEDNKGVYETFSKLKSRISLTTDMWTCTTQNKGYMVLTAHYIDDEWKNRKTILAFCPVEGSHTGKKHCWGNHEEVV